MTLRWGRVALGLEIISWSKRRLRKRGLTGTADLSSDQQLIYEKIKASEPITVQEFNTLYRDRLGENFKSALKVFKLWKRSVLKDSATIIARAIEQDKLDKLIKDWLG